MVLTEAGRELVGEVTRHRRQQVAALVRDVDDAAALARVLEQFAMSAGEAPERRWWDRWRRSTVRPAG